MNSIKPLFCIFISLFLFIHLCCAEKSIISTPRQWHDLIPDIVLHINNYLDFKSQNNYAKSCKNYHTVIDTKKLRPESDLLINSKIYNQAMIYYAQRNNEEMINFVYNTTSEQNREFTQRAKGILVDNQIIEWPFIFDSVSRVTIPDLIKIYSITSDFSGYLDKLSKPHYYEEKYQSIEFYNFYILYIIKLFLQQNMNINTKIKGYSLLHLAVINERDDFIKELFVYPEIDVNIKDDTGKTPLHYISTFYLCEKDPDFARDRAKTQVNIVKLFLAHPKIDLNAQDGDGNTILHVALRDKRSDLIDLLMNDSSVDLNIKNNKGEPPVRHKFFYKHIINPDRNFDINIKDKGGNTVLHYSIKHCEYSSCHGCSACLHRQSEHCWRKKYSLDKLKHLINDAKININAQNNKGQSPLHYAVYYEKSKLVKLLIGQSGITINIQDNEGNTPLHLALEKNWHPYIPKLLLNHSEININIRNGDGYTPLDCAIKENKTDIIKLLLTCKGIEIPFFYKHQNIITLSAIAGTMSLVGLLAYFVLRK